MQIHLARDGQRMGPFPLEEVNRQLAAGSLRLSDLAWYEGIPNWVPLGQVPGVSAPERAAAARLDSPLGSAVLSTTTAEETGQYAGFWIRVVAYILDSVILAIVGGLVGLVMGAVLGASGMDVDLIKLVSQFLGFLIGIIYFSTLWSSNMQASLGQKVCGLRLITTDGGPVSLGRAIGRYFALILAFLILCIGVIMVAFTERKQGLHDMLVGTYVIKGP
jgi:uncharacterized RDD family membrane protein YckC